MRKIIFFLSLSFFSLLLQGQHCDFLNNNYLERLKGDLEFLASDALKGRKPGQPGALMARDYLADQFASFGLEAAFEGNYWQSFSIPDRVAIPTEANRLLVNGKSWAYGSDFYLTKFSSNGRFEGKTVYVKFGIESAELDRDDIDDKALKGNVAVLDIGSPDGIHPHSKFKAYHDLFTRAKLLEEKGASAILLINENNAQAPRTHFKTLNEVGVPVFYISNPAHYSRLKKSKAVRGQSQAEALHVPAYNVGALLNNQANETVVVGAHYDHLGMGDPRSSLYRGAPAVHNGADDNASGVAGMLSLAHYLSQSQDSLDRAYNYLFLGFSAEEMGLLGSHYFIENLGDGQDFLFMLNMDMIGRMEEEKLQVNGLGTAPAWEKILENLNCDLQIITSVSGVGPSDHASFYYQAVPALHFFTGTHADYHKPTDDVERLNIPGIRQSLNFILALLRESVGGDFQFQATNQEQKTVPRFSVTLGVLPDYLYSGNGMRIDGITEGRPADNAGLQKGDIVIELGAVMVSDMQSYMEALSQFKKGDTAQLTFQRGEEQKTVEIQF